MEREHANPALHGVIALRGSATLKEIANMSRRMRLEAFQKVLVEEPPLRPPSRVCAEYRKSRAASRVDITDPALGEAPNYPPLYHRGSAG